MTSLITIGGGAAGVFAAITAAEQDPDLDITILERGRKPLAKVLISGGGRCNVTHACFEPSELIHFYPRGAKELQGPFTRFQPADTIAWFEQRGVPLKTEPDGRVFPTTDRSQTIVDCLLGEAKKLGIRIRTGCSVQSVEKTRSGFHVTGNGLDGITTRTALLAPGGNASPLYESARKLGHTIQPPVPSLFTFNVRDPRLKGLAGISVDPCMLTLHTPEETFQASGPLLITHWGLSGPAVLKLSAWAARRLAESGYRAELEVDWLPDLSQEQVFQRLLEMKDRRPRSSLHAHEPFGRIPARLWRRMCTHAGAPEDRPLAETGNTALRRLAGVLSAGRFQVSGKGVFKEEFVTCGGVTLSEVDFKTMESRVQPGLYFAGEMLDIDGLTGGFNFQSAWTTGYLAGRAIAARTG